MGLAQCIKEVTRKITVDCEEVPKVAGWSVAEVATEISYANILPSLDVAVVSNMQRRQLWVIRNVQ